MSQKLLDLGLNFKEIRKRIDAEKGDTANNIWAEYIKVSKSLISKIHPKRHGKAPQAPSLEYVIAVAKITGKSTDWYLYGETPENQPVHKAAELQARYKSEEEFLSQWPEEIRNACYQLKDILLSDLSEIKTALILILAAFQKNVKKEKSSLEETRTLNRRIQELENYHKAKQDTGTGGAASSSTGSGKM
jgi:hypothetical protein